MKNTKRDLMRLYKMQIYECNYLMKNGKGSNHTKFSTRRIALMVCLEY